MSICGRLPPAPALGNSPAAPGLLCGGHGLNSPHKDERDLVNGRHGKIGQQMGLGMFVLAEVSRESRIESDDSYIEWLSRVCQPGF